MLYIELKNIIPQFTLDREGILNISFILLDLKI